MKKMFMKRVFCVAAVTVMFCASTNSQALSNNPNQEDYISPEIDLKYSKIQYVNILLNITGGKAKCTVDVQSTSSSNRVKAQISLERLESRWTPVKTWDEESRLGVSFSETWAVLSGYTYRLHVKAWVYDSNNTQLEYVEEYSDLVKY